MKALTDKIIEKLQVLADEAGHGSEFGKGISTAINNIKYEEEIAEFDEVARQLMKHMAEKYHPHHSAIVTSTNAELLEGKCSTGKVMDYIKD